MTKLSKKAKKIKPDYSKSMKYPAVRFRRKVYVGRPFHADAIELAFAGMSDHAKLRIYDRVVAGKENIVFGFAFEDGSEFLPSSMQDARKLMYGFKD